MKRYEKYKPSGIEWIGEIPEHWTVRRMKFNSYIKARVGWHGLNSSEYQPEGPCLVTGTDFDKGSIDWSGCYHVDLVRYDEDPFIQLRVGDVLITKDGTIGKVAVVRDLPGPATLNSGVFVVRPNRPDYTSRYLYWALQSPVFSDFIGYYSKGSTIEHLYQDTFQNLPLVLPSDSEQTTIASYLDRKTAEIDDLIAKKQRLISLLNEEKTAIINHAVTKGLNPDVPKKDSGIPWLGTMPAHWELKKLKYLARILRGKFAHRPRNDERLYGGCFPFIQTGDVAKATKYVREFSQTLNDNGYGVTAEFPAGTLLMTIAANVGEVAILGIDACFPDSVVGFYPQDLIDNEFLFYKLKSMKETFLGISIINTQLNLNIDRISALFVSFPPKEEQIRIVRRVEEEIQRIHTTISKVGKEISLLQEYRTALINEAVTGKIDVRGAN